MALRSSAERIFTREVSVTIALICPSPSFSKDTNFPPSGPSRRISFSTMLLTVCVMRSDALDTAIAPVSVRK